MSLAIRRATADDASALRDIGVRTFVDTFGHMYPPEDLQAFLDESHGLESYQRYLADDRYAMWVLADGSSVQGYALAGPSALPHPDVGPCDGELKRLYVDSSLQNGGWGGRLFAESLRWLERGGPRTLWISVWSENFGAQRFYARHGFEKAGEYEFPVGRVRDREFIFRRAAQPQ